MFSIILTLNYFMLITIKSQLQRLQTVSSIKMSAITSSVKCLPSTLKAQRISALTYLLYNLQKVE